MTTNPLFRRGRFAPGMSLVLLLLLLGIVALGGGASREDALGQTVVRAGSATLLVVWALAGGQITASARTVSIFVGVAGALVAIQLIPLPPSLWTALPGRSAFEAAATLSGQAQPWRPIAIVPDAAWNALFSLIVPLATVLFLGGCRAEELHVAVLAMLAAIVCSALIALAQFSGASIVSPLINARPDGPSGLFANRNHQALFLAIGCMIAPSWALLPERPAAWRGWMAAGCVVLLLLMILATGSRAGLLLGALAMPIAAFLVAGRLRRRLSRAPRWTWPAILSAGTLAMLGLIGLSLGADRAESLRRLTALDPGQDMRTRALPVLFDMIRTYFPIGSGFGGFDPLFRHHEPFQLLKPTFFNHAHNDFLEIALTGGLPAVAALAAAIAWWLAGSVRAWRDADALLARLGSAIIFLILVASAFDYPARTPLVMAMLVLGGVCLTTPTAPRRRPTGGGGELYGLGAPAYSPAPAGIINFDRVTCGTSSLRSQQRPWCAPAVASSPWCHRPA